MQRVALFFVDWLLLYLYRFLFVLFRKFWWGYLNMILDQNKSLIFNYVDIFFFFNLIYLCQDVRIFEVFCAIYWIWSYVVALCVNLILIFTFKMAKKSNSFSIPVNRSLWGNIWWWKKFWEWILVNSLKFLDWCLSCLFKFLF